MWSRQKLSDQRTLALKSKPKDYLTNTIVLNNDCLLDGGFMVTKTVAAALQSPPAHAQTTCEEIGISLLDPILQVHSKHSFIRALLGGVLIKAVYEQHVNKLVLSCIHKLHESALELRTQYQLQDQKLTKQSGEFKRLGSNILAMLMNIMQGDFSLREIVYEVNKDPLGEHLTPDNSINWAWVDLGYYLLYKGAIERSRQFLPSTTTIREQLLQVHPTASISLSVHDLLFFPDSEPWSRNMQDMLCRALDISILHVSYGAQRLQADKLGSSRIPSLFTLLTANGQTGLILNSELYTAIKKEQPSVTFENNSQTKGSSSPCRTRLEESFEQSLLDLQHQLKGVIELIYAKTHKATSAPVKGMRLLTPEETDAPSAFQPCFNAFRKNVLESTMRHYDKRKEIFHTLFQYFQNEVLARAPNSKAPTSPFRTNPKHAEVEGYLQKLLSPFNHQTKDFDTLIMKYSRASASSREKLKLTFLSAWEKKILTHPDASTIMCFELTKPDFKNNPEILALLRPSQNWMFYHRHAFRAFIQLTLRENAFNVSQTSEFFEETAAQAPSFKEPGY